jgi:hypothetical protein
MQAAIKKPPMDRSLSISTPMRRERSLRAFLFAARFHEGIAPARPDSERRLERDSQKVSEEVNPCR